MGRDPVGKGQAPVGFSADLIPGVAAVDGGALIAAGATHQPLGFYLAAAALFTTATT